MTSIFCIHNVYTESGFNTFFPSAVFPTVRLGEHDIRSFWVGSPVVSGFRAAGSVPFSLVRRQRCNKPSNPGSLPGDCFDAAFGGEQSVGTRFRPAALRPLERAPDELFAGAFQAVGSDLLCASGNGRSASDSCWPRIDRCRSRRLCPVWRHGSGSSITRATCQSFNCCLILSVRAFRGHSRGCPCKAPAVTDCLHRGSPFRSPARTH